MNGFLDLKNFLDSKVEQYNTLNFIANDPICIPHLFSKKQDIEIMGFFAAVLAWGQRITIINSCKKLITLMDNAPHDFIINHQEIDLKPFLGFAHRTFNDTDLLYFMAFLKSYYANNQSLENAFAKHISKKDTTIEQALIGFHHTFFRLPDFPNRTRKHIATPERKSACKRLNMYLRWMVRTDKKGVDFGLWNSILPSQLICPCDLHVDRVARKLLLISNKNTGWKTALELTQNLRKLDANDPVKYDFALFGLGIEDKF